MSNAVRFADARRRRGRVLRVLLVVAVALPFTAWGAFRVWLHAQPDDFRAQIEQFSSLEFLGVLLHTVAPTPVDDRGAWGRTETPGRGAPPWVRRLALDGRPRMLVAEITPSTWVAWSTETAGIHQVWRGHIDFTGPVFDARHGREPVSRGVAWWRPEATTPWRWFSEGGLQPTHVQWRGHGFDPETGALWLRYDLLSSAKDEPADSPPRRLRTVTEWPEYATGDGPDAATLERRFVLSPGEPVALALGHDAPPTGTDGAAAREGEHVTFPSDALDARLVHRFAAPTLALGAAEDANTTAGAPAKLFTDHDCLTCHAERERVVGPAWSEVAARYADAIPEAARTTIAARIRRGGAGRWPGGGVMPPHPDLDDATARALAGAILAFPPADAPVVRVETRGAEATWTWRAETDPSPDGLHPSLETVPLDPEGFTPMVGGLAWLADGRLAVSTWDPDGAVFALAGWDGPPEGIEIDRIAEGLHEPLGLATLGDALYVMQKQEITRLVDGNGDGRIDEYRTVANDWTATSNFHEFGFGLVAHEGALHASLAACVLAGGKSCPAQTPDRGSILRVPVADDFARPSGATERLARGFRTPNGIAISPGGDLFVTDNQGDWLPASTLVRVRRGRHYGWRGPLETIDEADVSPPALWLPHNEIGNSPTQPLFVESGPYSGQILFGDIYNGGLKRAMLETIDGVDQGAAFHFSGGFEGPIHRLLPTPDRRGFVVGQVGSHGNWGEPGKEPWGLERVALGTEPAFEPLRVSVRANGFRVEMTRPLSAEAAEALERAPGSVTVQDWFYVRAPIYGGPKYDLREQDVATIRVSTDRRTIDLDVPGLEAGRVVYLALPSDLVSVSGERLWVREAWYTLNALPGVGDRSASTSAMADVGAGPGPATATTGDAGAPNRLSADERAAGWRLLFDGESFAGWKIFGADDARIEHWVIDDDALHFTRDVSFAGLVWNHLNPFTRGAVDLMTKERFGDFELLIDWRVSEGGNSGILYAIPDESTRLSWDLSLEMQVLDDAGHWDGQIERHRAGDLYDLQSLSRGAAKPAGEWNRARIRVDGARVRHWLNGTLVADLVRGTDEWRAAIAASKFAGTDGFGLAHEGHIALQDHGDLVWYRNVKVRTPDSEPPRDDPATR